MRRQRRTSLLIALMLVSLAGVSQKGSVRLFVKPGSDYYIMLDDLKSKQSHILTLEAGQHDISLWSYGYDRMDTTLTIMAGDTTRAIFELNKSADYVAYQRQIEKYHRKNLALKGYTSAFLLASTVTSAIFYAKHKSSFNDYEALEGRYAESVDPQEILQIKEEMVEVSDRQNKNLTGFQVALPVTIVAAGLTYWGFRKSEKLERPEYQDKNSVVFKGLSYNIQGSWQLQLAMNF
jgi:hypothetical protein